MCSQPTKYAQQEDKYMCMMSSFDFLWCSVTCGLISSLGVPLVPSVFHVFLVLLVIQLSCRRRTQRLNCGDWSDITLCREIRSLTGLSRSQKKSMLLPWGSPRLPFLRFHHLSPKTSHNLSTGQTPSAYTRRSGLCRKWLRF